MIDLSQSEVCMQFLSPYILEYETNGKESQRMGNRNPGAVPHDIYPCQGEDYWCAIAIFCDEEWRNFCSVFGDPSWAKEHRFNTFLDRKKNEDELNKLIAEWTIHHTAWEVMEMMQHLGIAAGVVKKGKDIYEDPQLREMNIFWELKHKEIGDFTHMGQPSKLSKTSATPRIPAPCLGEHTEYICRELLGISEEEFTNLLINGAFGH
jgi:crotonobetainyl-CoA:carnitine CoA-transferase CaiB-like acyl-CoA transferase